MSILTEDDVISTQRIWFILHWLYNLYIYKYLSMTFLTKWFFPIGYIDFPCFVRVLGIAGGVLRSSMLSFSAGSFGLFVGRHHWWSGGFSAQWESSIWILQEGLKQGRLPKMFAFFLGTSILHISANWWWFGSRWFGFLGWHFKRIRIPNHSLGPKPPVYSPEN